MFFYLDFSKTTKRTKICIKKGAACEALIKYMNPERLVNYTLTNATFNIFIREIFVFNQEKKVVKRKEKMWIMFCHSQFKTTRYTVVRIGKRWSYKAPMRTSINISSIILIQNHHITNNREGKGRDHHLASRILKK